MILRNCLNGTAIRVIYLCARSFAICNGINLVYNFKMKKMVSAWPYDSYDMIAQRYIGKRGGRE